MSRRSCDRLRRVAGLAAVALALGATAGAHELSRSLANLTVSGRDVQGRLTLDLLAFPTLDRNGDERVSVVELDDQIDRVYATLRRHFVVTSGGVPPQSVTLDRYEVVGDDQHVAEFSIVWVFPSDVERLEVRSTLHEATRPDHRSLVHVRRGGSSEETLLDASADRHEFTWTRASWGETVWRFLRLGVEHILVGYDHLAFLVSLLLGAATMRRLVAIVTSFTVGHSISLALAVFDVVSLPSRVVESFIALSIAYVALENLLGIGTSWRYRLALLFGLVHGLGFASILKALELPRSDLVVALLPFNVGVEIGQVFFVMLVYPLVRLMMARNWTTVRTATSCLTIALALYWFVERAFLT